MKIATNMHLDLHEIRKILLLTPGNIFWKDRAGRYLGCNDQQLKLTELKFPEGIIGKTDRDLYPTSIALPVMETDAMIMEGRQGITLEEVGVDREGKKAIFLSQKIPLMDEQSKQVIGIVGIGVDITQQKNLEKRLKKNLAEALKR